MKNTLLEYQEVIDNYPDAVIIFDESKIVTANKMAVEMLGWSKKELSKFKLENALETIISTSDREKYIEMKVAKVLKGENESFSALSQRKDKSIFNAKFIFNSIVNENGKFTQVIIKDVTERVVFEEAIRTSEERFKIFSSVVHNSAAFLYNDTIIDCNDQFYKLFEFFSKKEVIGKKIKTLIDSQTYNKIRKRITVDTSTITEIKTTTKKGDLLILEASINNINYQGQELEVLLLNDITSRKKTELILEQTTNRYKSLVESSPNGIFIVTDDKIKFANSRGYSMLGYQEEDDLYDKDFANLFKKEDQKAIKNDLQEIRLGKELGSREIKILDKEGNEIEISANITLTVYNNQPSFQVNIRNLTTRRMLVKEQMKSELLEEINRILKKEIENHKRTQSKLKEVQEFMINIFESSSDMIIAIDLDRNITEFNTAAQKVFGYTKEEALKMNLLDIILSRDDVLYVEKVLEKEDRFRGEVRFKNKKNKKILAYMSASWVTDKDGNRMGSMGVLRDITEQKKAEKKAIEETAKLDAIFNSTENMMIWIMEKDGRMHSANQNVKNHLEAYYGIDVDDGSNFLKKINKRLNKDLYQKQLEEFNKAFEGRTHQFLLPLVDLDKNEKWMQIFINPIYLDDGISEISCLMFDISERIIIEKRIRDSLKEKEVLLKEVHHRVKNNLQVISSILNLQSGFVQDEATLQILEESQSRIKAMSYIHETLYQTSDFSAIDFTEYMNTLVQNLIRSYDTTMVDLDLKMSLDQIELALDQSIPCGLIVNELVTNVMKYAFEDIKEPELKVDLKEKKNQILIRVADNGIGLPKDFKYEQSDSLGIQLVYTLVEQLHGNIEVNSKSGTEFLITFDKTLI